jgi:hypothetical protein
MTNYVHDERLAVLRDLCENLHVFDSIKMGHEVLLEMPAEHLHGCLMAILSPCTRLGETAEISDVRLALAAYGLVKLASPIVESETARLKQTLETGGIVLPSTINASAL